MKRGRRGEVKYRQAKATIYKERVKPFTFRYI